MRKTSLVILTLMAATLMYGCARTEIRTNSNASPAATSPTTTARSSDRVGVPECDAFIDAYEVCLSARMPEAVRGDFELSLTLWRKQWRDMVAQDPQAKERLVTICKFQRERAKETTKDYGCAF